MKQFRDTKYLVSESGNILNTDTNKYIKHSTDKDGYLKCTIFTDGNKKRNTFYVHRIVAEIYCDNFSLDMQVNHLDGIKTNNHFSNLKWVTCRENIIHSWKSGLKHKNYTQQELNEINRKSQNIRYSKLNDIEKEINANLGSKNGSFGKNYNKDKTDTELSEIRIKKQNTNRINKHKHLHKGGTPIIVEGKEYKSINQMSKETSYSFKYIKRRIESPDYKDWHFISTQGGHPNEN